MNAFNSLWLAGMVLVGFGAQLFGVPIRPEFPVVTVYATNQRPDQVATAIMPIPIFNFAVHNVAFNPGSSLLATGDGFGKVRLWDTGTGKLQLSLQAHTNWAFSIAWSVDGKFLVTGGGDDVVRIFDGKNPEKPLRTLRGHGGDVHSVALSPDHARVFSAGDDRQIISWNFENGEKERTWTGHARQIPTLALSANGKILASGSRDSSIRLWDSATGERRETLIGHTEDVMCVRFSPDGTLLASASYDQTVRLWDVANGKALHSFKGHTNRVFSVAFSPDGQHLASAGDSTVRLWSVARRQPEKSISLGGQIVTSGGTIPENISSVAFSGDGKWLAVSSTTGASFLLSTETGDVLQRFIDPSPGPGR